MPCINLCRGCAASCRSASTGGFRRRGSRENMNEKVASFLGSCTRIGALIAAVIGLYFGVYFLLLERKMYHLIGNDPATGQNILHIEPTYRVASETVASALRPAHWVDRQGRREYWKTIEHSSGR